MKRAPPRSRWNITSGLTACSQKKSKEGQDNDAKEDQEQWEVSINARLQRGPPRISRIDVHRNRRSNRKTRDEACRGAFPIELNERAKDDGIAPIGNTVYVVLILHHRCVEFPIEFDL